MVKVLFFIMLGVMCSLNAQHVSVELPVAANFNPHPQTGYNDCWGYTAPDGREYALLGVKNGTSVIDITDLDNLYEVGFIESGASAWKDIKVYKHYAYSVIQVNNGDGMQIIDLSDLPNSVSLVTHVEDLDQSHNIYIDVENAMLYADYESPELVRVYSLADPENPVKISFFGENCHDVYVQDGLAIVSEALAASYAFYDVSDPYTPVFLERIFPPAAGFAHNAWFTEDRKYMVTTEETFNKTTKLWNIEDLGNIELVSEYMGPNLKAHNAHIKGNYVYLSHYSAGLRILDIHDKTDMFETAFNDTDEAWGVYPYFSSGKVILSDIHTGLYVYNYEPAKEPSVGPSIVPLRQPAVITNKNSRFKYTLTVENLVEWEQKVDLWTTLIHPDGSEEEPLFALPNLTVNEFATRTFDGITDFDKTLPIGAYTYRFNVGNYPDTSFASHEITLLKLNTIFDESEGCENGDCDEERLNSIKPALVTGFALEQNFPNPFNPSTTIEYHLASDQFVTLKVYNTLGQEVNTLVEQSQSAGWHTVSWNGQEATGEAASTGIYIYQLQAGTRLLSKQMFLTK